MTMRIVEITNECRERIRMEGGEWPIYYRYGPYNWGALMGQSEEPLSPWDEKDLEELYQRSK